MERRDFVQTMCFGGLATFGLPVVRFARVPEPARLVFVLLRGGMDGLAAVVPSHDPAYRDLRGPGMAFGRDELVALDGRFALAPGLSPLRELWDAGEMVALHALAIPYRTRSHFDGQAVLETGLEGPRGSADGWLNRLLQVMEGERSGIAVAAGMPRSLMGPHPVSTWSPTELGAVEDAYLDRLHLLYRHDERLHGSFEAALQQRELTDGMEGGGRGRDVEAILTATARLLRAPAGPNVAAVEFSGWDTHARQGRGGGPLDRLLGRLAGGLVAFRSAMGAAWSTTTVVVMTEFGRTARPNGTGGTDHGTGGVGLVLGPRVARSAVVTDWPGLGPGELFEDRDLRGTLDTRAALKGVLQGAFDLTRSQVDRVFPGSATVAPHHGIMG